MNSIFSCFLWSQCRGFKYQSLIARSNDADVGKVSLQTPLALFSKGPKSNTGKPGAVQFRLDHPSDLPWAVRSLLLVCGGWACLSGTG